MEVGGLKIGENNERMIPQRSGFLGMWIPQEVDEAMPGGGKDTLPAILANASGSGLSETGPDQPQDLETRGLGSHAAAAALDKIEAVKS